MEMICKICNSKFKVGGGLHRHLSLHKLKIADYEKQFPDEVKRYKILSRQKRKKNSPMTLDFYLNKGMKEDEARIAHAQHIQYKNQRVHEEKYKNPRTYEYWLIKGKTKEQAKKILTEYNSKTKDIFIKKNGIDKYQKLLKQRAKNNTAEKQIKKFISQGFSENDAKELVKNKHRNGPKNIHYWLNRGYSETEARKKVKETARIDSPRRIEYWMARHKLNFNDAKLAVSLFQKRKSFSVSKESIKILTYLAQQFSLPCKFGGRDKELTIQHEDGSVFFYDFCVGNCIVEYNGSAFHPNPILLETEEKRSNWRQIKSKKTYNEIVDIDNKKKHLAESKGYKIFYIWDTDSLDIINKTIEEIKEVINGNRS